METTPSSPYLGILQTTGLIGPARIRYFPKEIALNSNHLDLIKYLDLAMGCSPTSLSCLIE
jgi:hypothetical protein